MTYDPELSRQVAERAIAEAAQTKDNPADLINVALEELVRARQELPGYTTLDKMAARIRTEVNGGFHAQIYGRIDGAGRLRLLELLDRSPVTGRSRYDDLKATAPSATLMHFREHLARLAWLDGLGPTDEWVAGVPPAKVAHFAAEARNTDAGDMRGTGEVKRIVLIACVLHLARVRGRDELATMFCKRMAVIHKQARERFEKRRDACRVQPYPARPGRQTRPPTPRPLDQTGGGLPGDRRRHHQPPRTPGQHDVLRPTRHGRGSRRAPTAVPQRPPSPENTIAEQDRVVTRGCRSDIVCGSPP